MKKIALFILILMTASQIVWGMGEIVREPYQEVPQNVELFGQLKFKMRQKIQIHQDKIVQTRELRNAIPDRQYKDLIERHQEAINELERYANRDIQYFYDYAYKLPRQEKNEGYSNVQFTEFLNQKITDVETQ